MATLVFSAIGTLLGGPIGGAIGALAGRQIDAKIFAPPARQGPRLSELSLSGSSYGLAIARQHGRVRTGGHIIWATDLTEQSNRQGGGKGRPATVTYSYSASFAVAVSSRPIIGIGRIWADGKLLRGAAGDLKVGGTLRTYTGQADQSVDPLMHGAEGAACPAYRGLAYVMFEDLQLAEFGNRIPALSFEVFADEAGSIGLQAIVEPALPDCNADIPLVGIEGLTNEGSPADLLSQLGRLFPLECDACDNTLTIVPERAQSAAIALPEPAITQASEDFGQQSGFVRNRSLVSEAPFSVLRHYDPDRDFQPGVQRSHVPTSGQPRVLELAATITAPAARGLIENAVRRTTWARNWLSWRISELDPEVRPGSLVTIPAEPGYWRVKGWEWRSEGVELQLERIAPDWPLPAGGSDPGRVSTPADLAAGPTSLVAFELPWDGNPATPLPQLCAAAGGADGWTGASLFVDQGDGALSPLGAIGRNGTVLGAATAALPPASTLLLDRHSSVTVRLASDTAELVDATIRRLVQGANRALLGEEIIQFATARPVEPGLWELTGLLRGRGGTEHAVTSHAAGEPFVLLESSLTTLDPARVGPAEHAIIAATGLADHAPVTSVVRLAGLGWRPLSPVHGRSATTAMGELVLRWTRRSRGGWIWADQVDLPLNEQREAYQVEFGTSDAAIARWDCAAPELTISAAELAALLASAPSGTFRIRQVGDRALSLPLIIPPL